MNPIVSIAHQGPIAIISIDNPPVNALSQAVRSGLLECVSEAVSDQNTQAIVLLCAGRTFIAGADISEFGKPPLQPYLPDVLESLDSCPKPIIAALHGTALGGGLETALACRYRIAVDSARIGLPEVNLGLIPGAGGTQRLPRIAGLANALDMITSGRHVGAREALNMGVIDKLAGDKDLLSTAVGFAQRVLENGDSRPRISGMNLDDSPENQEVLASWKTRISKKARGQQSPLAAMESISNALKLPFAEGLKKEREIFMDCMASPQSRALRHIFFAERAAAKLPESIANSPTEIRTVAVIGGGTMGRGIAMCFANKSIPVKVIETDQDKLDQAIAAIQQTYTKMAASGRISQDWHRWIWSSRRPLRTSGSNTIFSAHWISIAGPKPYWRPIPLTLISKRSHLPCVTRHGSWVCISSPQTSSVAISTMMKLGKTLGKRTVLVGNGFGFAANRMYSAYQREGQQMLLEGVTPAQLDQAMKNWGMAMGPTAVLDMSGIDIGYKARKQNPNLPSDPCYFRPANLLAELGYLGRKTGRGFYHYDPETGHASEDPEIIELIRAEASKLGVEQKTPSESEIQDRMIQAIAREGTSILEEGLATRSSDLDVIWINGYGFPRWRGGPMHYAAEQA